MANALNKRMVGEIESCFQQSSDCVVVDFTGMSVALTESVRSRLRKGSIRMRVVKGSLARIAAKNLGYTGGDQLFDGSAAIISGAESVADVARALRDIRKTLKKDEKGPEIRGGFLDKKAVTPAAVDQLAKLPTRPELLSQLLGTIIAPMTQTLGAITSLLTATPGLAGALETKMSKTQNAEGKTAG